MSLHLLLSTTATQIVWTTACHVDTCAPHLHVLEVIHDCKVSKLAEMPHQSHWGNACYRPGRLDKILYVPLPPAEGRGAILQALTRKTPLAVDVDVAAVGASPQCHGFSGADLAALVREACICALKVGLAQPL